MTPQFSLSPLFVSGIGFDRFSDLFEELVRSSPTDGYPPYDIEKLDEDRYRITLAVAGFSEHDLKIATKNGQLTVSGRRASASDEKVSYLYKGIAERDFERTFALADYMIVTGAEMKNGLLRIDLTRELPEDLKPRRIEIRTKSEAPTLGEAKQPKRLS